MRRSPSQGSVEQHRHATHQVCANPSGAAGHQGGGECLVEAGGSRLVSLFRCWRRRQPGWCLVDKVV
jgi:hypothetical protein